MTAPRHIRFCPACNGEGWIVVDEITAEGAPGFLEISEPCSNCEGLGIVLEEDE